MSGEVPPPTPVAEVDWFRRYPNGGGTVYVRPETAPVTPPREG